MILISRPTTRLATSVAVFLVAFAGQTAAGIDPRSKITVERCQVKLADPTVLCGTLTVPEARSRARSRMLELPFFVLPAKAVRRQPDPVAFLLGGPNAIAPSLPKLSAAEFNNPWRKGRDVIIFNYRGFAGTAPSNLDCPELAPARPLATRERVLKAVRNCRRRIVAQGANPLAYTTRNIARDIEDARLLLGRERGFVKWNVAGSSWGTRLAQAYVRDYPNAVRSLMLSSPDPLDTSVNMGVDAAPLEVAERFVSLCNANVRPVVPRSEGPVRFGPARALRATGADRRAERERERGPCHGRLCGTRL
jgi:pimeloyl-ACP methyl ester carboxylesterase